MMSRVRTMMTLRPYTGDVTNNSEYASKRFCNTLDNGFLRMSSKISRGAVNIRRGLLRSIMDSLVDAAGSLLPINSFHCVFHDVSQAFREFRM